MHVVSVLALVIYCCELFVQPERSLALLGGPTFICRETMSYMQESIARLLYNITV